MSTQPARMHDLVEHGWRRLYNVAFRMTLDRDRAGEYVVEAYRRAAARIAEAPDDDHRAELWLIQIAFELIEEKLPRQPEVNFDILDETLRSEATRTDVVRSLSDPQRDFLLWELKQGCMTAVIGCLSPGERAAFVAAHILRQSEEDAATALQITVSAFKVRLSRARKKVGDYLASRCEHVNPMNPCRCPARVGTALAKGFISHVPASAVSLRPAGVPYGRYGVGGELDDVALRDIATIYAHLPEPDPPISLRDQLLTVVG